MPQYHYQPEKSQDGSPQGIYWASPEGARRLHDSEPSYEPWAGERTTDSPMSAIDEARMHHVARRAKHAQTKNRARCNTAHGATRR